MEGKVEQWYSEQITVHKGFLYEFEDDFKAVLDTMEVLFVDAANNNFTGGIIDGSFELEYFDEHEDNFIRNRVTIRFSARGYIDDADYLT